MNGDIYVGDWKQGVPHGHGEMTISANGEQYVGQFKEGRRSGFGTIYYPNNSSFVGRFSVSKKKLRFAQEPYTHTHNCFYLLRGLSHNRPHYLDKYLVGT